MVSGSRSPVQPDVRSSGPAPLSGRQDVRGRRARTWPRTGIASRLGTSLALTGAPAVQPLRRRPGRHLWLVFPGLARRPSLAKVLPVLPVCLPVPTWYCFGPVLGTNSFAGKGRRCPTYCTSVASQPVIRSIPPMPRRTGGNSGLFMGLQVPLSHLHSDHPLHSVKPLGDEAD